MQTIARSVFSAVVVASVLAAPHVAAQDVTVHTTSTVRFLGGFGRLMSIAARFGGQKLNEPIAGATYISGHKLRTDNGTDASIVDLDAERITNLDNKAKTYTTMTFAEMTAMIRSMGDSLKAASNQAAADGKKAGEKGDVDMKWQVKVDRPGERAKIAGTDAERIFMTITTTANVTPEGEQTQEAGSMVMLVDEWVSKDAAQAGAMKEFERVYIEKLGQQFQATAKSLDAAFSTNPQMKEGFVAAAKERQKVGGVSMRSTTYVSFVPAGMSFDRQLALNEASSAPPAEAEEKKGGLRGMMKGLKKMADDANKNEEKPAGPPKQSTMMTVKTEVGRIETGRIDPSMFAPPAGYKEVKMRDK